MKHKEQRQYKEKMLCMQTGDHWHGQQLCLAGATCDWNAPINQLSFFYPKDPGARADNSGEGAHCGKFCPCWRFCNQAEERGSIRQRHIIMQALKMRAFTCDTWQTITTTHLYPITAGAVPAGRNYVQWKTSAVTIRPHTNVFVTTALLLGLIVVSFFVWSIVVWHFSIKVKVFLSCAAAAYQNRLW
jgi:hypothetical protein